MSYVATIEGQYFTGDAQDKIKYKPYRLKFRLASAEKPLSDIVSYLLPNALKSKHPDSNGWITHHLVDIYNEQDPKDVADIPLIFMNREQLQTFCKYNRYSYVEFPPHLDIESLRVEVIEAHQKGQKSYEDLIKLRKQAQVKRNEVLAGGEWIPEDVEPETQTPTQSKPKTTKKRRSSPSTSRKKTDTEPSVSDKGQVIEDRPSGEFEL